MYTSVTHCTSTNCRALPSTITQELGPMLLSVKLFICRSLSLLPLHVVAFAFGSWYTIFRAAFKRMITYPLSRISFASKNNESVRSVTRLPIRDPIFQVREHYQFTSSVWGLLLTLHRFYYIQVVTFASSLQVQWPAGQSNWIQLDGLRLCRTWSTKLRVDLTCFVSMLHLARIMV